jgi:hypothetical protein
MQRFRTGCCSLTSIMSSTGNPKVPQPTREASAMLLAPPPTTKEEYIQRFGQTWKVLRAGSFPQDEAKDLERAEATYARGLNPAGVGRQLRAILASGNRKDRLRSGQGADAGHSRHRRSAGAPRGRQGHRSVHPRRQAPDDRGHGPRAADPDVACDYRCDRPTRPQRTEDMSEIVMLWPGTSGHNKFNSRPRRRERNGSAFPCCRSSQPQRFHPHRSSHDRSTSAPA